MPDKSRIVRSWKQENLPQRRKNCPPVQLQIVSAGEKGKENDQHILWVNWDGGLNARAAKSVLMSKVGEAYQKNSRQRAGTWLVLLAPKLNSGFIIYHEGEDNEADYDICVSWYASHSEVVNKLGRSQPRGGAPPKALGSFHEPSQDSMLMAFA